MAGWPHPAEVGHKVGLAVCVALGKGEGMEALHGLAGMEGLVGQLDRHLRRSPRLGVGVYLARTAVVVGDVTLGDHSSVWYGAVLRGDINRIEVGHHSNIQDNSVLHLADDFPCLIGA